MSTQSIGFLRESELISRAASSKGLVLKDKLRNSYSCLKFDSEVIGTFNLERGFISALEKQGFTFGPGTKPPHNEMAYLSGHSDQRGSEVFESDCWAWGKEEKNIQLTVYFRLSVAERERGVLCIPYVWGNCSGGACHRPTIDKFVKVVAEHFPDTHPLIREAVNADFRPVISWRDIGLGGIRSIEELFDELYGRNEKVAKLAGSSLSPFDPDPNPRKSILEVTDRAFVVETDQPTLFKRWRDQLQFFKTDLV
ncbi:hypothetical protein HY967_01755 [Candidatus Jorgensenbacteria bacterium]|nr:hypothetical protein [Candidatus Jorgensenbacteria bacterium]